MMSVLILSGLERSKEATLSTPTKMARKKAVSVIEIFHLICGNLKRVYLWVCSELQSGCLLLGRTSMTIPTRNPLVNGPTTPPSLWIRISTPGSYARASLNFNSLGRSIHTKCNWTANSFSRWKASRLKWPSSTGEKMSRWRSRKSSF